MILVLVTKIKKPGVPACLCFFSVLNLTSVIITQFMYWFGWWCSLDFIQEICDHKASVFAHFLGWKQFELALRIFWRGIFDASICCSGFCDEAFAIERYLFWSASFVLTEFWLCLIPYYLFFFNLLLNL